MVFGVGGTPVVSAACAVVAAVPDDFKSSAEATVAAIAILSATAETENSREAAIEPYAYQVVSELSENSSDQPAGCRAGQSPYRSGIAIILGAFQARILNLCAA
jgi:hypothetical protein